MASVWEGGFDLHQEKGSPSLVLAREERVLLRASSLFELRSMICFPGFDQIYQLRQREGLIILDHPPYRLVAAVTVET